MDDHKPCDICEGSGEISFFKGVSRFLLSHEVCPACDGAGYIVEEKDSIANRKNDGHESESSEL